MKTADHSPGAGAGRQRRRWWFLAGREPAATEPCGCTHVDIREVEAGAARAGCGPRCVDEGDPVRTGDVLAVLTTRYRNAWRGEASATARANLAKRTPATASRRWPSPGAGGQVEPRPQRARVRRRSRAVPRRRHRRQDYEDAVAERDAWPPTGGRAQARLQVTATARGRAAAEPNCAPPRRRGRRRDGPCRHGAFGALGGHGALAGARARGDERRRVHGAGRFAGRAGLGAGLCARGPARAGSPRAGRGGDHRLAPRRALRGPGGFHLPGGRVHAQERGDRGPAHGSGLSSAHRRRGADDGLARASRHRDPASAARMLPAAPAARTPRTPAHERGPGSPGPRCGGRRAGQDLSPAGSPGPGRRERARGSGVVTGWWAPDGAGKTTLNRILAGLLGRDGGVCASGRRPAGREAEAIHAAWATCLRNSGSRGPHRGREPALYADVRGLPGAERGPCSPGCGFTGPEAFYRAPRRAPVRAA
jgi:hypothetical protein